MAGHPTSELVQCDRRRHCDVERVRTPRPHRDPGAGIGQLPGRGGQPGTFRSQADDRGWLEADLRQRRPGVDAQGQLGARDLAQSRGGGGARGGRGRPPPPPPTALGEISGTKLALRVGAEATLAQVGLEPPTVVCLGAERAGLPAAATELADASARIPMRPGGPDSLNVAMAATVALYELGRRMAGHG
jgi:hypothetical protein